MESKSKTKVVLIGAGKLATHLASALLSAGFQIQQVYSRTKISAKKLAGVLNTKHTTNPDNIFSGADLYVLCLTDEANLEFIKKFNFPNATFVHTSGTLSIDIFSQKVKKYGVIYPVQSFYEGRKINFRQVPLCIEASDLETEKELLAMASRISDNCTLVDSMQRQQLHLAAVFANNFGNHMFAVAEELMKKANLSFDMLLPLIQETTDRIGAFSPEKIQTGPAVRNDRIVIKKHLELLSFSAEYKEIYKIVSNSIQQLAALQKEKFE